MPPPALPAIYVTNSNDNTVSVINGARCNWKNTRGCRRAVVATVKVGGFPIAATLNPVTRTVKPNHAVSPDR